MSTIPAHELRILEAHIRRVRLVDLTLSQINRPELNEYEQRDLAELIRLRSQGLPLQYLTGTQDFYGREFYINTHVLIPRPETEALVEQALQELKSSHFSDYENRKHTLRGLELGTGSGCIALTLLAEMPQGTPDFKMVATEASFEAIKVALENAQNLKLDDRLQIIPVDYDADHESAVASYRSLGTFDFFISNPPYLTTIDEIADDVLQHEPHTALFAKDDDGLDYYRLAIKIVKQNIFTTDTRDQAIIEPRFAIFEISHDRAIKTKTLFSEAFPEHQISVINDLSGRPRIILIKNYI